MQPRDPSLPLLAPPTRDPPGAEGVMQKRYTRRYRHWSPRFKWKVKALAGLIEFEREWKGWRGTKNTCPKPPKG
jgi:hypothetical protein